MRCNSLQQPEESCALGKWIFPLIKYNSLTWKRSSSIPTARQMQYDRATGVIPMNSKSSVQAEERKYTLTSVEKTHRKDFSHVFPKPSVLRKGCAGCLSVISRTVVYILFFIVTVIASHCTRRTSWNSWHEQDEASPTCSMISNISCATDVAVLNDSWASLL